MLETEKEERQFVFALRPEICQGCWAGIHFPLMALRCMEEDEPGQMLRGQMEQTYPLHSELIDYSSHETSPGLGRDGYLAVELQHGNSSCFWDHRREAPADYECLGT